MTDRIDLHITHKMRCIKFCGDRFLAISQFNYSLALNYGVHFS